MAATYSFDITSTIDMQELDNAINQARKELAQRFDFKGSTATIELNAKESKIEMKAEDASRLKSPSANSPSATWTCATSSVKTPPSRRSDTPRRTSSSSRASMATRRRRSSR